MSGLFYARATALSKPGLVYRTFPCQVAEIRLSNQALGRSHADDGEEAWEATLRQRWAEACHWARLCRGGRWGAADRCPCWGGGIILPDPDRVGTKCRGASDQETPT